MSEAPKKPPKPQHFDCLQDYLEARGYEIKGEEFHEKDGDDIIPFRAIIGHTPVTYAEKRGWER